MGSQITMEIVLYSIFIVKEITNFIKLKSILCLPEDLNFVLFLFSENIQ